VDAFPGRPAQTLALIPRAMQPHADRVDTETVTFVGPCFEMSTGADGWTRPRGSGEGAADLPGLGVYPPAGVLPPVRCRLRRPARLARRPPDRQYTDPGELGAVPSNIEVRSWVPQRAILEQADAFVTHAGVGGCNEGLLAGVPMIAVRRAVGQFMNADRFVELGVARRIDTGEATAEALRAALEELVSDADVVARRCCAPPHGPRAAPGAPSVPSRTCWPGLRLRQRG
jgi:hypothetical protein